MSSAPTKQRLIERLRQLNQSVPDDADAQMLADIINQALCDQACCSRALVDGKEKLLKFDQYWSALYGKWTYVPHQERGLLTEGQVRGRLNGSST